MDEINKKVDALDKSFNKLKEILSEEELREQKTLQLLISITSILMAKAFTAEEIPLVYGEVVKEINGYYGSDKEFDKFTDSIVEVAATMSVGIKDL